MFHRLRYAIKAFRPGISDNIGPRVSLRQQPPRQPVIHYIARAQNQSLLATWTRVEVFIVHYWKFFIAGLLLYFPSFRRVNVVAILICHNLHRLERRFLSTVLVFIDCFLCLTGDGIQARRSLCWRCLFLLCVVHGIHATPTWLSFPREMDL